MIEIWKPVVGYEALYEVSNLGAVRSLARKVRSKNNSERSVKERLLIQSQNGRGYLHVGISNGKSRSIVVHRLVATAFLGVAGERMTVNHKDGNKANNHVDNLEWVSVGENNKHAIETRLRVIKRGVDSPNYGKPGPRIGAKASRETIEKIRASKIGISVQRTSVMHVDTGIVFKSIAEAARYFGIKASCLRAQLRGQNKNKSGLVYL